LGSDVVNLGVRPEERHHSLDQDRLVFVGGPLLLGVLVGEVVGHNPAERLGDNAEDPPLAHLLLPISKCGLSLLTRLEQLALLRPCDLEREFVPQDSPTRFVHPAHPSHCRHALSPPLAATCSTEIVSCDPHQFRGIKLAVPLAHRAETCAPCRSEANALETE